MGFVCPECLDPGKLEITGAIDIQSDSRSDEITLQTVECSGCRFRAIAVYEESRRGALDSEAVDHYGCRVDEEGFESIAALIRDCPRPRDEACDCSSHELLDRRNEPGRWNALDLFSAAGYFSMDLAD